MSWYEKLLETAKDVAPTVAGGAATALSGGNIALGSVVSSIMSKVLGRPVDDVEEASQEILGDPSLTMEYRSRMRDAEIKELEIRTKDVQDARDLVKSSKGPVIISGIIVTAFTLLLCLVMFVSIPAASQAVAYLLMGTLAAEFTRTTAFWLGSSLSSKDKDTTISRFASAAERDQAARRENADRQK